MLLDNYLSQVLRISLFLFLFIPTLGISQAPNFIIKNYTVEDGLPSNETYRIVQDHEGYIWIATDRGLTRWDGYKFKVYGAEQGLVNISVINLIMDDTGKIWLCTLSGDLYCYERNSDQLVPYQFMDVYHDFVGVKGYPRKFSVHENEKVILSAGRNGDIIAIDSLGQLTKLVNVDSLKGQECLFLFEGEIHYSGVNNYSPKIIGKYNDGIPILETKTFYNGIEFPNCPNPNSKGGNIVDDFNYSKEKRVIISNLSNHFFQNEKYRFCQHDSAPIRDIKTDITQALYVSRLLRGGLTYYKDDEQFEKNTGTPILSDMSMGGLLIDKAGDLWACSLEGGIYHIKISSTTPINDSHVKGICKYKDGFALIEGASQLKILNEMHQIIHESELADELSGLSYIPNLDLLMIFGSRGYQMNQEYEFKKLSSIAYARNAVEFDINTIVVPSNKKIIITEYIDGLTDKIHVQSFPYRNFDVIFYQNKYYLASMQGLFQHEDLFYSVEEEYIKDLGMRTNDLELFDNLLLLGSNSEGLLIYDGENITDRLTTSDRLLSNSVELVKNYNDEYILVGTKQGISIVGVVNGKFHVIKNITTSFGLPSNNILDLEIVDDQIYYATSSGSGYFTFDVTLADSTEVLFDGWQVNQTERKEFSYDSDENNITINYKTLDFRQEGNITYRYRLNDEEWNETKNTSVNYASLNPGKYNFTVQSQNENGNWGHVKSQEFAIAFPWYQTWWFRTLVALGILGLGYFIYKRRISAITKDVSIKEEIRQLELQALRAQMNPHFIFNCLTSIQNFIHRNESESAMSYLSKFAKLVRQTLNASSEEIHSLQDELNMLENYLALEQLRFKELFTYDFQIENGLDPMSISIPPMLIQPLVENSIKHGFQGIDYQGVIQVAVKQKGNDVQISIEDNGKGITSKTSNSKRKSFGSSIAARRLELISLTEAKLEVMTPLSGQGTLVRMIIPQE